MEYTNRHISFKGSDAMHNTLAMLKKLHRTHFIALIKPTLTLSLLFLKIITVIFVLFFFNSIAYAATYSLPSGLGTAPFNNCTLSSANTYNCTANAGLTIPNNSIINLPSQPSAPLTLNLTKGSFNAGNNLVINANGNIFSINVLGNNQVATIGNNFTGSINLTANGQITIGNNATLTGDLTANQITLPTSSSVTGYCSPSNVQCTTPLLPSPIADFRMNDLAWSGTNAEVTDAIGSYSGTAASLASTKPTTINTTPAIAGNPGTCRYGVFNRSNKDYVALPTSFPNLGANGTAFTITAWVKTTNSTLPGQRIFVDDENNTGGFGFSIADENQGVVRFFTRGTPSITSLDTGNVIANNTWYFVAAVADIPFKKKYIYVYNTAGTLVSSVSATWTEASFGSDNGVASIGGETNASGEGNNSFGFAGNIDELKIFQSALSANQLNDVRQVTNFCTALDHVRLSHTGNGVTCTGSTVTVTACNSFDTGNSCSVNTNGLTGNVIAKSAGGVILATVPFTIPGGSSATTVSVAVTTPQTVSFETSNLSTIPANTRTCWDGSTASCSHVYNDSGFVFNVPNHVAELTQTFNVSAVKKSNNALACVPAFASTSKNVNFKCSYNNPVTGTKPARINNNALNTSNNTSASCDSTGRNISLSFDATGVASANFQYADVGDILLSANYVGSGADAGLNMTGSDSAIAAPKDFAFSSTTTAPIKAGSNFSTTVSARNAVQVITPNFGKESTPENASLSFSKCQPTGTNASVGVFTGALGAFVNGVATSSTLKWTEVGNGDLTATLTSANYLGTSITATGNTGTGGVACNSVGNIGRFIPDHFDTIVTQGCEAGSFSYAAQPFSVQIKAMNALGDVTKNYDGSTNTNPNFSKATTLSDANAISTGVLINNATPLTSFSLGIASAMPSYSFSSALTSPATIKLRAIDTDSVSSASGIIEGNALVRSGRMRIQNAYGSELLDLPTLLIAQYWSNGAWVLNSSDICTTGVSLTFTDANLADGLIPSEVCVLDTGNPGSSSLGCSAAASSAKRFKEPPENGNFNLTLRAPGGGNAGSIDVTANVPSWLQFNWNGTGNVNPSARATFGIYKAPIIYLREIY